MSNRHLGRAKNIIASQKGPEPKDSGSGDSNGRRPDPRERRQAPSRGKALLERSQAKRAAKREQRDERREARGSVGAQQ